MKALLSLLVVCLATDAALGAGAGRAFPIDAENYVISKFTSVNPNIGWDYENALVDRAGHYANCANAGYRGFKSVDAKTQDGHTIAAIVDFTAGSGVYVDEVNAYIRMVIDSWMDEVAFMEQVRKADSFGCSVRPGCSGQTVVACLFSPGTTGGDILNPTDITVYAQAFTREQYDLAERMTGNTWDKSYFLENLSGTETSCSMVGAKTWSFAKAKPEAAKRGITVLGLFGEAANRGSTQRAMEEILLGFKQIPSAVRVGCSLIPDCPSPHDGSMHVVVSCIYEEEPWYL